VQLKKRILDYAIDQWSRHFTGVSAISIAEELSCSHEEVLSVFTEFEREKKGSLREDVKLYQISISLEKLVSLEERQEIVTSIFFPSKELLTEYFFTK
jgi:hypothetical protein